MFLLGNRARDENAEMADRFVNGINNRLTLRLDVLAALIEIKNPTQRLLWGRDVVGLGTEDDDRGADVAQIEPQSVLRGQLPTSKLVADKKFVGDVLHLCGIEKDVPTPPFLEFEEAGRFLVDLGINIIELRPICVGGVEILEIRDEPGAIELPVAKISHQRGEPGASEQAAGIPHGIFAVHTCPVSKR